MKFLKHILIIVLVFTSCKSKKVVVDGRTAIKELSAKKVAKKHIDAHFDKNTIDAKLKVKYKNQKQDVGFSVRMKIKKDEAIYLKGSKVITVFKAKITPNEVSYYSPHFKNRFVGDFSMLKKILGVDVDFKQLQNMLLGQALLDVKEEKQDVEIADKSYKLSPKNQHELFTIFFYVNPLNFKLNKQEIINTVKDQRLNISYDNYTVKDNVVFPEKMRIKATSKEKFTDIDISVRSIVFDTDLSMPFTIPSGYKEIKL